MFWHGVPSFLDLDAAVWFRQSGNLRGLLSGAVRKNLVESFRIHAAFLGNSANRGWSAFLLVNAAHEADHRPVMVGKAANAFGYGDFPRDGFTPIAGIREMAILVERQCFAQNFECRHVLSFTKLKLRGSRKECRSKRKGPLTGSLANGPFAIPTKFWRL